VTLNPYLGRDSIQPFLDRADKGVILLCRTSNPGGADFQALDCGGQPLYLRVAETIARDWNAHGNCALVTGATWPEELGKVRAVVGDMPLLVPGIGAQGGDVEAVLRHGRTAAGTGLLISSSRAILYAGHGEDFAAAARAAASGLRDTINRCRRG
jgi:orotidine-5'-phosphate decarboxylase